MGVDIHVQRETTAPPEAVLDTLRETDLERRGRFWSQVKPKYSVVHESGPNFLDITEGDFSFGLTYERSRYEWSEPGTVAGTVLESNVIKPGSTFVLRASPRDAGGSLVELRVRREFWLGPKGRIGATINHLGGGRIFGWYLGTVLKAVEEERT